MPNTPDTKVRDAGRDVGLWSGSITSAHRNDLLSVSPPRVARLTRRKEQEDVWHGAARTNSPPILVLCGLRHRDDFASPGITTTCEVVDRAVFPDRAFVQDHGA